MRRRRFIQHTFILCIICLLAFSTVACRDDFNIVSTDTNNKLVAYVFPSTADTTYIQLWKSIPVGTKRSISASEVREANIQYSVNGMPRKVYKKENGMYYTTGKQQTGDLINLSVSTDSLPNVESQGSIPQAIPIISDNTIYVTRIGEDNIKDTYYQIQAHFTDPEATADYYAVRILVKDIAPKNDSYENLQDLDSAYFWADINTKDEIVLNHISDIDNSLGFNNMFYRNFYIFNDHNINGLTHTLRLNVLSYQTAMTSQVPISRSFKVFLYKLSPEYYKFLKSINELANNKLARYGLSQMKPSFTNIRGGFGVLGCYALSESDWMKVELEY